MEDYFYRNYAADDGVCAGVSALHIKSHVLFITVLCRSFTF